MKSQPAPKTDSRQARGEATRQALMRAAEKLIAAEGIENVSIRHILTEAGQKNASALQYHFGNLQGLISALHDQRALEVQQKRAELIDELTGTTSQPSLRQLCTLMIQPPFELARSSLGYRRYVKAFGHELAVMEASALTRVQQQGGGGDSGVRLRRLLRAELDHLDDDAFRRRMELAVRLCASAMSQHAWAPGAFRGDHAELFISSLTDGLAGLLGAAESPETRALARTVASD